MTQHFDYRPRTFLVSTKNQAESGCSTGHCSCWAGLVLVPVNKYHERKNQSMKTVLLSLHSFLPEAKHGIVLPVQNSSWHLIS